MLPYRLRPPTFGGKELKQKQTESKDEILSGGGPVQRAMELDLMELRPVFLERLENMPSPEPENCHSAPGEAFRVFGQVFGEAKIALVNTRTLPPRCDRDAYAQLIYSACLSLLKSAFQQEIIVLEHAAFPLFCLYALYETNPLPREPTHPLQMLPMGLQCAESPSQLYRRAFRNPIRVDRYHFSLLQRVRDEALARQADCQSARMQAWESRVSSTIACTWSCTCAIAKDMGHIVDRLMSCLDYGEYTGPRGLEAFAGHADYPYSAVRPKKANKQGAIATSTRPATSKLTDRELDALVEAVPEPNDKLVESIDQYRSSLQSIRLAPAVSNQATRIRDALKPIFGQTSQASWQDVSKRISDPDRISGASNSFSGVNPHRNVGPQSVAHNLPTNPSTGVSMTNKTPKEDTISEPVIGNGGSENGAMIAENGMPYQLVLPNDMPEAQQIAIRIAVNSLIERGEHVLGPQVAAGATAFSDSSGASKPNGLSSTNEVASAAALGGGRSIASRRSNHFDDSYSVRSSSVTIRSDATGEGQAAMRALLSMVAAGDTAGSDSVSSALGQARTAMRNAPPPARATQVVAPNRPPVPLIQQRRQAHPNQSFGDAFLTMTSNLEQDAGQVESDHSDISSVSSGDASDASSDVGQAALREILAAAKGEAASPKISDRKRKAAPSRGSGKIRRRRKQPTGSQAEPGDDSSLPSIRETSSGDASDVSSDVGQAALREILAAAKGGAASPKISNRKRKVAPSRGSGKIRRRRKQPTGSQAEPGDDSSLPSIRETGKAALDALLSQISSDRAHDDDETVHSSEAKDQAWV